MSALEVTGRRVMVREEAGSTKVCPRDITESK